MGTATAIDGATSIDRAVEVDVSPVAPAMSASGKQVPCLFLGCLIFVGGGDGVPENIVAHFEDGAGAGAGRVRAGACCSTSDPEQGHHPEQRPFRRGVGGSVRGTQLYMKLGLQLRIVHPHTSPFLFLFFFFWLPC